jgi:hypothetical protein
VYLIQTELRFIQDTMHEAIHGGLKPLEDWEGNVPQVVGRILETEMAPSQAVLDGLCRSIILDEEDEESVAEEALEVEGIQGSEEAQNIEGEGD